MVDERAMETIIGRKQLNEAEEIMDFLENLDRNEKKDFMVFIQGVKFAKGISQTQTACK